MDEATKKLIETNKQFQEEIETLRAQKKELELAVAKMSQQTKIAVGESEKSSMLLERAISDFSKRIEEIQKSNALILKNQAETQTKNLAELQNQIERNNLSAKAQITEVRKEVAQAVTAVTTLKSDFDQTSTASFKKLEKAHQAFANDAVSVSKMVGREVRTSLGAMRFFPYAVGLAVILLGLVLTKEFLQDGQIGDAKTSAYSANVRVDRLSEMLGHPTDDDSWDAYLKKYEPKRWNLIHQGDLK